MKGNVNATRNTPIEVWHARLQSYVDEASVLLARTAFSEAVRESKDFTAVLMDRRGDCLVNSDRALPSFMCVPLATRAIVAALGGPDALRDGDVLICNDPWLCTGQLNDIVIVKPIYASGELAGFAGTFAHWPDIGGRQLSPDNREVFEEGITLPPSFLRRTGHDNDDLLRLLWANLRNPAVSEGDMRAQIIAVEHMERRVHELLDANPALDLGDLAEAMNAESERSMRRAIAQLPDGVWESAIETDGHDEPFTIKCRVTIFGDEIEVDFDGSSPQVAAALNSVYAFTYVYTVYPFKCFLDPDTPSNDGSARPIRVIAPEGSILNARRPVAVGARSNTAHFIHAAIIRALADVMPDRLTAESGSCPVWSLTWANNGASGRRITHLMFMNGGQGATALRDGADCYPFPSNVGNSPIELTEQLMPVLIRQKALRQDSGGRGTRAGGRGQLVEVEVLSEDPVSMSIRCDRLAADHEARGIAGGGPGTLGAVWLNGERVENPRTRKYLRRGNVICVETPGGGAHGEAVETRHG